MIIPLESPDDSYCYECVTCGECCCGEMQIRLTPRDLNNMMIFHGMDHSSELESKGWIHYKKGENGALFPFIRFTKTPFLRCPFLINDIDEDGKVTGLCSMHPHHKPLICRTAPLSRELDLKTGEELFSFIPPWPGCPGIREKKRNTLKEELEPLRRELDEERIFLERLSELMDREEDDNLIKQKIYTFHSG